MTDDAPKKEMSDAADEAVVQWRENAVPYAPRFRDTYFSDVDGRAETREVFVAGNGLPERWSGTREFVVAELGFGTGLNFLETVHQWRLSTERGSALRFISFEKYPLTREDLATVHGRWAEIRALGDEWMETWPPAKDDFRVAHEDIALEVFMGDAALRIEQVGFLADAWYLDGFSPSENPDLWDERLLQSVFDHTAPGGTFSTYTAAGWVRRNLQASGFDVSRVSGFGRKRERLQGFKRAN